MIFSLGTGWASWRVCSVVLCGTGSPSVDNTSVSRLFLNTTIEKERKNDYCHQMDSGSTRSPDDVLGLSFDQPSCWWSYEQMSLNHIPKDDRFLYGALVFGFKRTAMNRILQLLIALRVLDPDRTVSLTNCMMLVLLYKVAVTPQLDWTTVSTLFLALAAYQTKKILNKKAV